jgi:hypothetical protein
MGILRFTCLPLLLLLLTGCYEDFTPDIDTKPVLCLNSLITEGEPIKVSVTRTWLYTDTESATTRHVDDAEVTVYVNGAIVGDDYLPQQGDNIRIVAESRSYGRAEGEVTVPEAVPAESVEWDADVTHIWKHDTPGILNYILNFNLHAKLTIKDPAGTDNYYLFSRESFPEDRGSYPVENIRFYPGVFRDDLEPIFSEHIGVFESITGDGSYGFTFFTDRQFQGSRYTLNLQFENLEYDVRNEEYSEDLFDCGLILNLSSVSSSYYNWCSYQWQVENGTLSDLTDVGLSDPFWGYSNVSTGAGVIAARSSSSHVINLKDFLQRELARE